MDKKIYSRILEPRSTMSTPLRHRETEANAERPLIEVGWIVVGHLDPPDRQAVSAARERMRVTLAEAFPGFDWRMPLVEREAPRSRHQEEPVALLELGAAERQAKGWDYALVVTGGDLLSFYKPFALGAPARSLSVAVLSTVRIDPLSTDPRADENRRTEIMTRRLHALALHLFGHLNDLSHGSAADDFMFDVEGLKDLDRMERFSPEHLEALGEELADVADTRLEEAVGRPRNRLWFYLRATWHERGVILGSVRRARPWQFPVRLSRLTTAALSAMLILLITAEVWDLGMNQSPVFVAVLSVLTLGLGSLYLLIRQRLLIHREASRLSELMVVTNVSMALSVFFGMLTTYAGLFALVLGVAQVVFTHDLILSWAASLDGRIESWHYLVFAGFIASLGLLIGALGASFEEQRYFHHVTLVDEET